MKYKIKQKSTACSKCQIIRKYLNEIIVQCWTYKPSKLNAALALFFMAIEVQLFVFII